MAWYKHFNKKWQGQTSIMVPNQKTDLWVNLI
jgi:hypothetical protein